YTGDEQLDKAESYVEMLIEKSHELDLMEEFITMDEIKGHAQNQLLEDGVNPGISVDQFEYVEMNNLNEFYSANNVEEDSNIEDAFEDIVDNHEIDSSLSRYEKRSILMVYHMLDRQGHLAYQPINIGYGIKDATVAKIEEGLANYNGIDVSIEPVRYYPEGHTAAHMLGTLGKISQPEEIDEFVTKKNYSSNAIIGKTG